MEIRTIEDLNTFLKDFEKQKGMEEVYVTELLIEMPQPVDRGMLPNDSFGFVRKMSVQGSINISLIYKREL